MIDLKQITRRVEDVSPESRFTIIDTRPKKGHGSSNDYMFSIGHTKNGAGTIRFPLAFTNRLKAVGMKSLRLACDRSSNTYAFSFSNSEDVGHKIFYRKSGDSCVSSKAIVDILCGKYGVNGGNLRLSPDVSNTEGVMFNIIDGLYEGE